jgi:BMFP domain-containing protein YqiC
MAPSTETRLAVLEERVQRLEARVEKIAWAIITGIAVATMTLATVLLGK